MTDPNLKRHNSAVVHGRILTLPPNAAFTWQPKTNWLLCRLKAAFQPRRRSGLAGGRIIPTWPTCTFVPSPDAALGDGDIAARCPYLLGAMPGWAVHCRTLPFELGGRASITIGCWKPLLSR
jgi:hypothetical protein